MFCFVAVASVSLAILWPRKWEFTANPLGVIESYTESAESVRPEELHRDLSLDMQGSYLENRKGLKKLVVFFQVANVLLAVEVVLWIIAIASAY